MVGPASRPAPLVAAIAGGAVLGSVDPSSHRFSLVITPVLALLLFAAFLGVAPFMRAPNLRGIRFLGTSGCELRCRASRRFLSRDLLLTIAASCSGRVSRCSSHPVSTTWLSSRASPAVTGARLLAATPLLMLLQIVLLPVYVLLFAGWRDALSGIDVAPFAWAFVSLYLFPLIAAALVQALACWSRAVGRGIELFMQAAMVPSTMLPLQRAVRWIFLLLGERTSAPSSGWCRFMLRSSS